MEDFSLKIFYRWGPRILGLSVAILAISGNHPVRATSSPGTQTVRLFANQPVARTGQTVSLYATAPQALSSNQTLSIMDLTTQQVMATIHHGSHVTASYLTNQPTSQSFGAVLSTQSTPLSVQWVDRGVGNNQGYQNAKGQTVTVAVPSQVTTRQPFTLTAMPQGFNHPEFQFWWARNGGTWHSSGPYSSHAHFTLTAQKSGLYAMTVYARSASAPAQETAVQQAQYEAKALTQYIPMDSTVSRSTTPIVPKGSRWTGLSTANAVNVGALITLKATTYGVLHPQFQFWFQMPSGHWMSSGHYASPSQFTVTATTPGTWHLLVFSRSTPTTENPTPTKMPSLTTSVLVH